MKSTILIKLLRLLATAAISAGAFLTTASAQTAQAPTPLAAQIVLRPLTAVDISTYGLPSTSEYSGGLSTVGVGTAVYLEADVTNTIPLADVTNVSWSWTGGQPGSSAILTNSPLGLNVPIYEPSMRLVAQVAGRALFRPEVAGQYTVTATLYTVSGSTTVTQTITAGTYVGAETCSLCHEGGVIAADKYTTWVQTLHAQVFSNQIDGDGNFTGSVMRQSCLQCHTTGYDVNTNAIDFGFNYLQSLTNWTIPGTLTNGNFVSMQAHYPSLAGMANVQCESCHGPGSQHIILLGTVGVSNATNSSTWPSVSVVENASGDCNQCHDDATHHPYGTEWLNSVHAVTTTDPAGNATCVGCHTAYGFIARIEGVTNNVNTSYAPIDCQTCHEPHGDTIPTNNPHMIRTMANVTLMDGTVITNAGEGLLCMECHQSREKAATYAATTKGSSHFGPHEGPQADMLEGVNGFTYGLTIPSSDHASVSNTCVACHMQIIPSTDPAFLYAGSHTFNVKWSGSGTNAPEDLIAACQECHGPTLTSFNFPVEDFDGSGVTQGVQTQVQSLLNELSMLLPPGGVIQTNLNITSTWTQPELEAAYNWMFVNNDGSLGVHNTSYAVGLLQASIANLTGVSVAGGLPDAWVIQYFGSITNPAAAPNAINNSNGIPNWMMYALGLNPTTSGITLTNGVVYGDVTALGGTNTVQIYTAAEVVFDTQVGQTYQIQSIGSLSGGWQNVGSPMAGTGQDISFLTPTRNNAQQYFRVVTTTTP